VEERDELARKLQERSRELDSLKNSNVGNKSDRARVSVQPREQTDRHYEMVVEGLRRQNSELQSYYKQRLEEAERERKSLELAVASKDN